ncbi:hypothetical protein EK21DRAFT_70251 [Setomelanomma holmii]|uniref:Heterokaryon incompatibility domain-containing protein n=1 Tax=Setomelanomma holmii TaxID=210430 RepID=A0A9P4H4W5_9PLEO|nr:hypothetical protein EK21DRAFT_70251 [Setomelanomma holmii]
MLAACPRPVGREIRVLDLLPGCDDDEMKCEIRIINLDAVNEYEALSYVWGERNDEKEIEISGLCVQVTSNLHAALRRLRKKIGTRAIWIDQLCINQLDNDERAAQVAMMRDIYRRCAYCIMWFGEVKGEGFDLADAAEVFAFLNYASIASSTRRSVLPVLFEDSERGIRTRRAFAAFSMYGNPWWSRCRYDIPVATLFEYVTLDLIRDEGGLRPLLGSSEMPHRTPGLATWAIDFACTNWVEKRQLKWWTHSHRYRAFRANAENTLEIAACNDGKMLAMTGVYVDRVAHVGQVYSVSDRDAIDALAVLEVIDHAWAMLGNTVSAHKLSKRYFTGQSWSNAFQKTMIGDFIMEEFPVARADDIYLELETLLEGQGRYSPNSELWESVCGMVPNHVFFVTQSGYISIGPPDTQPGDEVWVLYGGQVPFILRPTDQSDESNEANLFRLVGDAYVHGIMDGEAVQAGHVARTISIA